jgi:hypothetical protein
MMVAGTVFCAGREGGKRSREKTSRKARCPLKVTRVFFICPEFYVENNKFPGQNYLLKKK